MTSETKEAPVLLSTVQRTAAVRLVLGRTTHDRDLVRSAILDLLDECERTGDVQPFVAVASVLADDLARLLVDATSRAETASLLRATLLHLAREAS